MTDHTSRATTHRDPTQLAAAAVGAVFLLVGILGFVPGVTTNYDDLQFAGHHSSSELLGVFQVSILHNLVHLLFGVAGLAMARTAPLARNYLIGGRRHLPGLVGLRPGHRQDLRRQLRAPQHG